MDKPKKNAIPNVLHYEKCPQRNECRKNLLQLTVLFVIMVVVKELTK